MKWTFRKYQVELWQQWSLDSVRDQRAVWAACALPWLHIHSPSQSSRSSSPVYPSYSCNTDSTHRTSAPCGLDFQSTYGCITVGVDYLPVPSNLHILYAPERNHKYPTVHWTVKSTISSETASHRLWFFSIICSLKTLQPLSLFVISEDQQFSVQLGSLPRS